MLQFREVTSFLCWLPFVFCYIKYWGDVCPLGVVLTWPQDAELQNPHGSWWSVSPTYYIYIYILTCFNNNSGNFVSCSICLFESEDNTKFCVENLNQFIEIAIINWLMCSSCGKEVFIFVWVDWCLFLHRWEILLEGPVFMCKVCIAQIPSPNKWNCIFIVLQCQVPIVCSWKISFSESGLNEIKLKVSF
jgi:hypothetical protein